MEIWINPSCSKCAVALAELRAADVEFEQRRYLEQPPTEDELTEVLRRLGLNPWDVTRLDEHIAAQLGMRQWPQDRERWIRALVEHPELIQRPILLLDDGTAMLGRDADAVRVAVRRREQVADTRDARSHPAVLSESPQTDEFAQGVGNRPSSQP